MFKRKMGLAQRQSDNKRGALADLAFHGNRSAVLLHQFLDQGQPNAAAFMGSAPHIRHPMKSLEQAGYFFGWNADASIANAHLSSSVHLPQRDRYLAFKRELQGIREEVQHDLFPHLQIHVDRLTWRDTINCKL